MIKIKKQVVDGIIEHARQEAPVEACGYLAGRNGVITKQYRMKNIDNSPVHFTFDPEDQFEVMRKARDKGLEIIANYHSHPSTPARPSHEDIRLAFDPRIHYLIISLAENKPVIVAWKIENKVADQTELIITD